MKRLIVAIPTTSTHLQVCHSVVNEEHHNIGISKGQRRNIHGSADPFWALVATARQLQAPGGCPWDQAQTISSLLPHLIEETWEVFEVVRSGHHKELQEELGDVLYTVLFLTLIAERRGLCRLETLLTKTRQKMIRRHPHVFQSQRAGTANEAYQQWEAIKRTEKKPRHSPSSAFRDMLVAWWDWLHAHPDARTEMPPRRKNAHSSKDKLPIAMRRNRAGTVNAALKKPRATPVKA